MSEWMPHRWHRESAQTGYALQVKPVSLYVWIEDDGAYHWMVEHQRGQAKTLDEAKQAVIQAARSMLRQALGVLEVDDEPLL